MLFKYDLNGFLREFKTDLSLNDATVTYLNNTFPFKVTQLDHFKQSDLFKVDEILQDLSFSAFWHTYDRKVGNKSRAEKLWKVLTDIEKIKALNYIKTYNNFLITNSGIQKLYPETYLAQKRFNNE